MSDIIYEAFEGANGINVKSPPDGLKIGYNGDLDYDRSIVIPWDEIIKAMPTRAVKENERLFKNIICVGCRDKRPKIEEVK